MTFLSDHDLRPLEIGDGRAFRPVGLALGKGAQAVEIAVLAADRRPSVSNLNSYIEALQREPLRFPVDEVLSWTDTAALPLLPDDRSGEVFARLRKAPRLDLDDSRSWKVRVKQGDMNAPLDKPLMRFIEKQPDDFWPVFKGESFDIWVNDTGSYYGWADPDKVIPVLQSKRQRSAKQARSPFAGFPPAWFRDSKSLPCWSARIAFRDVSRATDSRTVRAALLPPKVFVVHIAPTLLWPRGDEKDQAYLLGVLSSIPLDWYARLFVELHLTYDVFNPLPIPRPSRDNPLWQRAVALAVRLACPDKRFRKWAEAVGVEYGPLSDDEKQDMIHELDAVIAHLYGLAESQLTHIFETFHEGWDYTDRLKSTLKYFHAWGKRR